MAEEEKMDGWEDVVDLVKISSGKKGESRDIFIVI